MIPPNSVVCSVHGTRSRKRKLHQKARTQQIMVTLSSEKGPSHPYQVHISSFSLFLNLKLGIRLIKYSSLLLSPHLSSSFLISHVSLLSSLFFLHSSSPLSPLCSSSSPCLFLLPLGIFPEPGNPELVSYYRYPKGTSSAAAEKAREAAEAEKEAEAVAERLEMMRLVCLSCYETKQFLPCQQQQFPC